MLNQNAKSRRGAVKPVAPTPVRILEATVSSPAVTITFDQPVRLSGLPAYGVDVGAGTVAQANQTAPNQVELVYSEVITGATTLTIPYQDPAIRSSAGGFVADTLYLMAA